MALMTFIMVGPAWPCPGLFKSTALALSTAPEVCDFVDK